MNWGLILSLGIGVGWIIGVTVSIIASQISGLIPNQTFTEALGNTFVFGFPGILLFIIAIIVAIREDLDEGRYGK